MANKPHIQILVGSTRPGRVGIKATNWFLDKIKDQDFATIEVLDLEKIGLPFLDEPNVPGMRQYTKDHTKEWSKIIEKADGYIWVTPEYNHASSPVLLNAIDFLYHEWNYKPVSFLGYGGVGAARAIEQLVSVASELKMIPLEQRVSIVEPWLAVNEVGEVKDDYVKGNPLGMIEALSIWADGAKSVRERFNSKS